MTFIEEIENTRHISHADVDNLATILIRSISGTKNNSPESFEHQNRIISQLILFLEKYLGEEILNLEDKLVVIKILDKIQLQREVIEMKLKGLSIEDLKVAAERLGKKSQSAFGSD
jgi:hypothetical protein